MSILGIINLVIFVMLVIKCGLGRGIGYIIGNWFITAFFGLVVGIIAGIATKNLQIASIAFGITQIVVTLMRMKKAVKDIRDN